MAQRKGNKKKPPPRRKTPDQKEEPCKVMRLGLIVGDPANTDLDAAAQWMMARAAALGGSFRLWHSRESGQPLKSFRDIDVTGGAIQPGSVEHFEHPGTGQEGYETVLADCANCRGRIEELVIFHHGSAVDESVLGERLVKIIQAIHVPICRVVWWSCNAAVSLDVAEGHWTDMMMRRLGKFTRCRPCGCDHPIELVWPTTGKCYLTGTGANDTVQTNDGQVNRAQWGYRWPDGSLRPSYPPPAGSTVVATPGDREPPFDKPIVPEPGSVLGMPVGKKP